jgi:hypothetical protein
MDKETKECKWVVIDGECYVPCLNSITKDVNTANVSGFDFCPYCGGEFDLKKDKDSIKRAMHAMEIEHDKEVMEDEIEAEMRERQDMQIKLFREFISKNEKGLTSRK